MKNLDFLCVLDYGILVWGVDCGNTTVQCYVFAELFGPIVVFCTLATTLTG